MWKMKFARWFLWQWIFLGRFAWVALRVRKAGWQELAHTLILFTKFTYAITDEEGLLIWRSAYFRRLYLVLSIPPAICYKGVFASRMRRPWAPNFGAMFLLGRCIGLSWFEVYFSLVEIEILSQLMLGFKSIPRQHKTWVTRQIGSCSIFPFLWFDKLLTRNLGWPRQQRSASLNELTSILAEL